MCLKSFLEAESCSKAVFAVSLGMREVYVFQKSLFYGRLVLITDYQICLAMME